MHHGIWDLDIPCAPILADITVNGRPIKAVAQPTKQAWVYVFDRVTGQPVWPIEERPVEKGDVPGEWYSPTQPFVTKPPAFERQGVALDDLIDFTPELSAEAVKLVSRYKIGPLFTPPVVSKWDGPLGTLMLPCNTGGANWQGGALDPETKILYIFSNTNVSALGLVPPDVKRSDMDYVQGTRVAIPMRRLPTRVAAGRRRRRCGLALGVAVAAGGGGGGPLTRPGPAADQAALRPHHGDRSEQGRHRLADRARRDARQHPEPSGAQGPDHSAHGPARPHRDARDQDAGHRRRGRLLHDSRTASAARCCAPTTRPPARKSARSTCRRRRPDRR